eukprot:4849664-Prymnesium_polylepis.1
MHQRVAEREFAAGDDGCCLLLARAVVCSPVRIARSGHARKVEREALALVADGQLAALVDGRQFNHEGTPALLRHRAVGLLSWATCDAHLEPAKLRFGGRVNAELLDRLLNDASQRPVPRRRVAPHQQPRRHAAPVGCLALGDFEYLASLHRRQRPREHVFHTGHA